MEKHSKRYRSSLQVSDLAKDYPLAEAVDILAGDGATVAASAAAAADGADLICVAVFDEG